MLKLKFGIFFIRIFGIFNQIMKSIREIFKNKEDLLNEPEVQKLVDYCEELQDEIVELKFQKTDNKELALIDMIKEVIKGCEALEKEQMEHERFGYDAPDYKSTVSDLKRYIYSRCKDEKIWIR